MADDRGRPRSFKDADSFVRSFGDYLEYCSVNERFPNVAGFCVYADITRETFYKQNEYYSDAFKKIDMMLEDETLNARGMSPAEKIFYLKNKFSKHYRDKVETTNVNLNHEMTEEEAEKILKEAGLDV